MAAEDAVDDEAAINVEIDVRDGPTSSVLIDAAHEAELLVLGSRGLGGFSRLVLGSTSTQCATHAPVPTAIIPLEAPLHVARGSSSHSTGRRTR